MRDPGKEVVATVKTDTSKCLQKDSRRNVTYLLGFEFLSICMISCACEHALVAKQMDLLHIWKEVNQCSRLFPETISVSQTPHN